MATTEGRRSGVRRRVRASRWSTTARVDDATRSPRHRGAARDPRRRARPGADQRRRDDAHARGRHGSSRPGSSSPRASSPRARRSRRSATAGSRSRRSSGSTSSPSHLRRPFDPGVAAAQLLRDVELRGLRQGVDRPASRCAAHRSRPVPSSAGRVIAELPDALRAGQRVFDETGGLHAAGLFATDGTLVLSARGRRPPQRASTRSSATLLLEGRAARARPDRARLRAGELRARAEGRGRGHPDPLRGVRAVDARGRHGHAASG